MAPDSAEVEHFDAAFRRDEHVEIGQFDDAVELAPGKQGDEVANMQSRSEDDCESAIGSFSAELDTLSDGEVLHYRRLASTPPSRRLTLLCRHHHRTTRPRLPRATQSGIVGTSTTIPKREMPKSR